MFKRRAPNDGDYTKFDENLFGNLVNSEVIPVTGDKSDTQQSYFTPEERDPFFTDSFTGRPEDAYMPSPAYSASSTQANANVSSYGSAAPDTSTTTPFYNTQSDTSFTAPQTNTAPSFQNPAPQVSSYVPQTSNNTTYGLATPKPQIPFADNSLLMPLRTSERPKLYALRSNANVLLYEYTDRLEFYKVLPDGVEFYYAKPKN